MDDKETLNRRARLRELVEHCFSGKLEGLLVHIADRTGKKPNQGEMSALRKDHNPSKSFGDKKAKTLTEQIGLHRRWFDMPLGSNLSREEWRKEEPDQKEIKKHIEERASLPYLSPLSQEELALLDAWRTGDDMTKAMLRTIIDANLKKRRSAA